MVVVGISRYGIGFTYVERGEKVVFDMPKSISSVIKQGFYLTPFQLLA